MLLLDLLVSNCIAKRKNETIAAFICTLLVCFVVVFLAKKSSEPTKANGKDAPPPPSDAAPALSGALYSTVDLNKKKQEREAKNGRHGEPDSPSAPAPAEPAVYASVDNNQEDEKVGVNWNYL